MANESHLQRVTGGANAAVVPNLKVQATATVLSAAVNVCQAADVVTDDAQGVMLPKGRGVGEVVTVMNMDAGVNVDVFPQVGGTIYPSAKDALFAVTPLKSARFTCVGNAAGDWVAMLSA